MENPVDSSPPRRRRCCSCACRCSRLSAVCSLMGSNLKSAARLAVGSFSLAVVYAVFVQAVMPSCQLNHALSGASVLSLPRLPSHPPMCASLNDSAEVFEGGVGVGWACD